ncbi:restriction endonuclease subunit S [Rhizobium ruizarguesonis]|uniref:restriction endonuclease subunit S n=1 Tax=Rhizobium ruizarguesonis TaxID=2081791 RepID=UPI0013B95A26|nr:restriction endonuclease subunit S [Rhizobium ruizarguesonis]NEH38175.1 restriction endonuclease subunit S [Rhizobium ruizarguesonis]
MTWREATIGEIGSVKGGKRLPEGHQFASEPTSFPYIRARDIGGGKIEIKEPVYLQEHTQKILSNYTVRTDDIVITIVGANVGDVGYVSELFDGANLTENAAKISVNRGLVNPYFLKTFLAMEQSKGRLSFVASGAAQGKLGLYKIKTFQVPIPPVLIQDRIADLAKAYDDLIENNRRRIALLEEVARMLHREWFVEFRFPGHEHVEITHGLPGGWERRKFSDVCETIGGGTPQTEKPEYWNDGDIPWYTPTDITRNSCLALLDSATKITEAGLRGSSAKMLPSGTLLMTSRASVGFFGIIETPSCTNQGFISVIPHDPQARMYLLHNLMHRVEEIRSHAGGATYKEISKGKFRELPVVIPEASLLREFEEQVSNLHAQVRNLHMMNQKLTQARNMLLPRLMNGEITV